MFVPRYLALPLLLAGALSACSATAPRQPDSTADRARAEKKIALAIGQETGSFTIASQAESEAPGGSVRTDYVVVTPAGAKFNCHIFEPSRFGKVMSWGMASGSDAVCREMRTGGKAAAAPAPQAACNDLLRAAGKCGR